MMSDSWLFLSSAFDWFGSATAVSPRLGLYAALAERWVLLRALQSAMR
jgi:hypothetical protein